MSAAYVDSSCLVALAFGERAGESLRRRLAGFEVLLAANLLEAELHAAFKREGVPYDERVTSGISWVLPHRPLGSEITRALSAGLLRGADLWHLAVALYVAGPALDLTFLTLDRRQRDVAERLGFST